MQRNDQRFTSNAPGRIVLSLGSNQSGNWGDERTTLQCALNYLHASGIHIQTVSSGWLTKPIGLVRQDLFLNLVAIAFPSASSRHALRYVKTLEWRAGRRSKLVRWGPRPLDIDLVDYHGATIGWPPDPSSWRQLTLPHPHAHRRAFVLAPLAEVWPDWRHPVLGLTAKQLLSRLPKQERNNVQRCDIRFDLP